LDFFGGTLSGIRAKLSYLKELGATALYLNPIFYARTNHRYDTNDYRRVDPWLGDEGDFARLCQEAEALGIRVLLDGVFSHTGADSEYFRQAQRDQSAPTFGWYRFSHWPDRYESWWGFQTLPETNELDPGFLRFILTGNDAVIPHWLRAGAGGWRLDVADELPMPFLRMLRETAKCAKPDAALIGEVWEDASNKISYGELRSYCLGDTLDSVMNYPLRDALVAFLTGAIDANNTARRINALYEQYPKPFAHALMNLLGSHDRPRILNILAGVTGETLSRTEQGKLRLTQAQRALGLSRLR
ncbi:MAG TPA: glycoside hydrolase family 13 protein, partial [Clostridia bacterium]|nr:glycoside hydrolase family 13 protein [Clostridia bacterium]